jgi:hypothetical protein
MPSKSSGTPAVKREAPEMPSMPTTEIARPIARAPRPRTTDSVTTAEIATKANTASARYSAGPNRVASSASRGAKNTTRIDATMPPMNAPIADVASAWAARPLVAILWPSIVPAIAVLLPGVFIRMPEIESPNRPPKSTPANMMKAPIGSSEKVTGRRSATAIAEPRPGSTPTAVPSRAPMSTQSMLIGVRTVAKPSPRFASDSIRGSLPGRPEAG